MANPSGDRLFRFSVFEADEQAGELRKQGRRLPLQGQPLQVLFLLLERPGDVVGRAEIQKQLWPEGTFVDFDHGLNTAINKIRDTLDDSATSPRFVETLARRGYRFISPVEVADGNSTPAATSPAARTLQTEEPSSQRLLTAASDLPVVSHPIVRLLALLLQVMYLAFYVVSLARFEFAEQMARSLTPQAIWVVVLMIVTAAVGIPIRLYLLSSLAFRAPGLREKFLRIFPALFLLDELWALAPFLLVQQIGFGLALGATAALLYSPFAQRSLVLMGAGAFSRAAP